MEIPEGAWYSGGLSQGSLQPRSLSHQSHHMAAVTQEGLVMCLITLATMTEDPVAFIHLPKQGVHR